MIKTFTSEIDGCQFNYEVVDGQLSYQVEGTDWQDSYQRIKERTMKISTTNYYHYYRRMLNVKRNVIPM